MMKDSALLVYENSLFCVLLFLSTFLPTASANHSTHCCTRDLQPCSQMTPAANIQAQFDQIDRYLTYGFYEAAAKRLNTVYCQLDTNNASQNIQFLNTLADLSIAQQNPLHAQYCLYEAEFLARQHQELALLADTLNKQGNMLILQANASLTPKQSCTNQTPCYCPLELQESNPLLAYRESLKLAKQHNLDELTAKVLTNIASANITYLTAKQELGYLYKGVKEAYLSAQQLPTSALKTNILLTLSQLPEKIHQELRVPTEANEFTYQMLQTAIENAEHIQDKYALSQAYGFMAAFYELKADLTKANEPQKSQLYQKALTFNRQALLAARQADEAIPLQLANATQTTCPDSIISTPELHYRWHQQQGRVLHKIGQLDEAIIHVQKALTNLLYIQKQLTSTGYHVAHSFEETIKPIYDELISVYTEKLIQAPHNQVIIDKLADILESYKISEYNHYYQLSPCINPDFLSKKVELPKDTAVIYPFLNKQQALFILVKTHKTAQLVFSDHQAQSGNPLDFLIKKLIKQLSKTGLSGKNRFQPPAEKLYHLLISPIIAVLTPEIKNLIIIPNENFRIMPFAALYDGQQFLFEQYNLATALSLNSIDLAQPKSLKAKDGAILLGGISEGIKEYSAMPTVVEELKTIEQLYFNKAVLKINDMFTYKVLNENIQNTAFSILHFSTHGKFEKEVERSYLLTYDGLLQMPAFRNLITNRDTQMPLELITLSACQTAVGNPKAALGLAGIALNTGAKSALASLWRVNARSTTLLITEFYKALNQDDSVSKIQALQAAQKVVQNTPEFAHPHYWSGFILIGNWL